ncbi:MAG: bifunctional phosphoribosyl-AMP cyclohydrolase/phosphoribosyl-ATP diphosphatase HisIE [Chloroflexi bacterium]|nr:bifunctional phosphoribosyl-AMP cyclohydrolase/phosphoribosyl-ATP diphosphatase HisIE [Chloroflexota bacterium]
MADLSNLRFDDSGLIPAIVQDAGTREVLMVAYMNADAVERTLAGPDVWLFSRSRNELWHKGETSGNFLRVVEVRLDCDGDALLVLADPAGPACHTGNRTCFFGDPLAGPAGTASGKAGGTTASVLDQLYRVIEQRKIERPEGSYTAKLFADGTPRIAQKVVEEAGEVAIAAVARDGGNTGEEVADLLYHTLVLMAATGVDPAEVWAELEKRRK